MLGITSGSRSSRVTSSPASCSPNGLTFPAQSMTFNQQGPKNGNSWSWDRYKQKIVENVARDQYGLAAYDDKEGFESSKADHSIQIIERAKEVGGLRGNDTVRDKPRRRRDIEHKLDGSEGEKGNLADLNGDTLTTSQDDIIDTLTDEIMRNGITPVLKEFTGPSGKPLGVEVASNAYDRKDHGTASMENEYAPQPLKIRAKKRSSLPDHLDNDTKKKRALYEEYPHEGDIHKRSILNSNHDEEDLEIENSTRTIQLKSSPPAKVTVHSGLGIERPQSMYASVHEARDQVQEPRSPLSKPLPPLPQSKDRKDFHSYLPTIPSNESLRLFSSEVGREKNAQSSTSKQAPVRKHSAPTHTLMRPIQAGEKTKPAIQPRRVQFSQGLIAPTVERKQSLPNIQPALYEGCQLSVLPSSLPHLSETYNNSEVITGKATERDQLLSGTHPALREESDFINEQATLMPPAYSDIHPALRGECDFAIEKAALMAPELQETHPALREESDFVNEQAALIAPELQDIHPGLREEMAHFRSLLSSSSTLVQTCRAGATHAPLIETLSSMNARLVRERAVRNVVETRQESNRLRDIAERDIADRNWRKNGHHLHSASTYIAPLVRNTSIQSINSNNFAANSQAEHISRVPAGSSKTTRVIDIPTTTITDTDWALAHGAPTAYSEQSLLKIAQILTSDALKDGSMIKKRLGPYVAPKSDEQKIHDIVEARTAQLAESLLKDGVVIKAKGTEPGRFGKVKGTWALKKEKFALHMKYGVLIMDPRSWTA